MKHAAISSAHAKQFVRVAAMADQYDLSDEQKQYALVKAYERHGERIGGAKVVSLRRQGSRFRYLTAQRLWRVSATEGHQRRKGVVWPSNGFGRLAPHPQHRTHFRDERSRG